jgi:hypothetical protein
MHGSLKVDESSPFDAVPRNTLEIEIPASRTVCVKYETQGHQLGAKPLIAGVAPPGSHPDEPPEKIIHSARATRAKTVSTSTPGTDHTISTFSELAARIPKTTSAINRTPGLRCARMANITLAGSFIRMQLCRTAVRVSAHQAIQIRSTRRATLNFYTSGS